jgi:hypothetical protein
MTKPRIIAGMASSKPATKRSPVQKIIADSITTIEKVPN